MRTKMQIISRLGVATTNMSSIPRMANRKARMVFTDTQHFPQHFPHICTSFNEFNTIRKTDRTSRYLKGKLSVSLQIIRWADLSLGIYLHSHRLNSVCAIIYFIRIHMIKINVQRNKNFDNNLINYKKKPYYIICLHFLNKNW